MGIWIRGLVSGLLMLVHTGCVYWFYTLGSMVISKPLHGMLVELRRRKKILWVICGESVICLVI